MSQFLNVKGIENGTITCNKLDSGFLGELYSTTCFSNDVCSINTDDVNEGLLNLYFTNTRADARVLCATGANLDLSQKTTDDLTQGSCNLYFSDSLARQSLCGTGDITYCDTTGEISVTTYKSSDFDTDFSGKFTCDLAECGNLYYTDARADARIATVTGCNLDLSFVTTDDLPQGTCNLYATGTSISEDDALALAIALG